MSASTIHNVQVISREGKREYAVLPYTDYLHLIEKAEDKNDLVPHEVVALVVEKDLNILSAWRKHLDLTQKEVARHAGITQSALSQMERTASNNRTATLEKLAKARGIEISQLVD